MRRAAQALAAPGAPALPVALIDAPARRPAVPPRCIPVLQAVAPPAAASCSAQVSAAAGRIAGDCVVWAARAALRGEIAAHRHGAAAQGGAGGRRLCLSRPHRTAAGRGRGPSGPAGGRGAGAHDAGQRRAAHRAGQHPHVAARCDRGGDASTACCRRCASRTRALAAVLGRRAADRRGRASIRMRGRAACSARRSSDIIAPAIAAARAEGIDADGPASRPTPSSCAPAPRRRRRRVRRGDRDVPRPGPDPGQVPGRGEGRERDAGPAAGAHQPRSRHRVRHRGHGPRRCRPA